MSANGSDNPSADRLATEVVIRCRPDGPLVIEGPARIVDSQGRPFPLSTHKPLVALCRCGHSANKPFCDGSHHRRGWVADDAAPPPIG
jgi:CDGSH-type Zn-finger protein